MTENKTEIYTDGSCLGNPGPGGWGVLILMNNDVTSPSKEKKQKISSNKYQENSLSKDPKNSPNSIQQPNENIQLSGSAPDTTNNRMEMTAIIKALEWLHHDSGLTKEHLLSQEIIIHSDSNLLISTLNLGWKRKANLDLWEKIDKLRAWLNIEWNWVKAHHTNKYNNQVDKLALAAAQKCKTSTESNYSEY